MCNMLCSTCTAFTVTFSPVVHWRFHLHVSPYFRHHVHEYHPILHALQHHKTLTLLQFPLSIQATTYFFASTFRDSSFKTENYIMCKRQKKTHIEENPLSNRRFMK